MVPQASSPRASYAAILRRARSRPFFVLQLRPHPRVRPVAAQTHPTELRVSFANPWHAHRGWSLSTWSRTIKLSPHCSATCPAWHSSARTRHVTPAVEARQRRHRLHGQAVSRARWGRSGPRSHCAAPGVTKLHPLAACLRVLRAGLERTELSRSELCTCQVQGICQPTCCSQCAVTSNQRLRQCSHRSKCPPPVCSPVPLTMATRRGPLTPPHPDTLARVCACVCSSRPARTSRTRVRPACVCTQRDGRPTPAGRPHASTAVRARPGRRRGSRRARRPQRRRPRACRAGAASARRPRTSVPSEGGAGCGACGAAVGGGLVRRLAQARGPRAGPCGAVRGST